MGHTWVIYYRNLFESVLVMQLLADYSESRSYIAGTQCSMVSGRQ